MIEADHTERSRNKGAESDPTQSVLSGRFLQRLHYKDDKLDPLQTSDLLSDLRGNYKHIREHKQINQSKK